MFFMMLYDYYVAGKDENYICINQYFPPLIWMIWKIDATIEDNLVR